MRTKSLQNTTRAHAHTQPLDMVTQTLAHSAGPAPDKALGAPPPSLLEAWSSAVPALQKIHLHHAPSALSGAHRAHTHTQHLGHL